LSTETQRRRVKKETKKGASIVPYFLFLHQKLLFLPHLLCGSVPKILILIFSFLTLILLFSSLILTQPSAQEGQHDAGGYGAADDTSHVRTHGMHQEVVARVGLLAHDL